LAAQQTISLVKDRKVIIVPTKTIAQGINAMVAFDLECLEEDNLEIMTKAAANTHTGQITFAARDADYLKVKEGDIIALKDGKLVFRSKDPVKAAIKLINNMSSKKTKFLTLLYGDQITAEQAKKVEEHIENKLGSHVEFAVINGGQPVYHFILAV
jgi:dihydroxyacetone kinase-like predicted kinase